MLDYMRAARGLVARPCSAAAERVHSERLPMLLLAIAFGLGAAIGVAHAVAPPNPVPPRTRRAIREHYRRMGR